MQFVHRDTVFCLEQLSRMEPSPTMRLNIASTLLSGEQDVTVSLRPEGLPSPLQDWLVVLVTLVTLVMVLEEAAREVPM